VHVVGPPQQQRRCTAGLGAADHDLQGQVDVWGRFRFRVQGLGCRIGLRVKDVGK
jgi:hypothetical protein